MSGVIVTKEEKLPDGKRITKTSTLKLKAEKAHHDTNITCAASNSADTFVRRTSIHLLVEFAPDVTVTTEPARLYEGDTVTFRYPKIPNKGQPPYLR